MNVSDTTAYRGYLIRLNVRGDMWVERDTILVGWVAADVKRSAADYQMAVRMAKNMIDNLSGGQSV